MKTVAAILLFLHIHNVEMQCSNWDGSDWEEDIQCSNVKDPQPGSDVLVAFKGTRELVQAPSTPDPSCNDPDPHNCAPRPELVTFDSCKDFMAAIDESLNRAWWKGWCLIEEFSFNGAQAQRVCKKYKHGRQAYVPDLESLNSLTNIITQWGNASDLQKSNVQIGQWYIGLRYFKQSSNSDWWQWKISNNDTRVVRPLGRSNTHLPWGNNEPDNFGGTENCGVYDWKSKKLADFDCNKGSAVLCEYPACQNNHKKCDQWAKRGECDKNPEWMDTNCQKSCQCDCNDERRKCLSWALDGECDKNREWMTQYCKKRCNKC